MRGVVGGPLLLELALRLAEPLAGLGQLALDRLALLRVEVLLDLGRQLDGGISGKVGIGGIDGIAGIPGPPGPEALGEPPVRGREARRVLRLPLRITTTSTSSASRAARASRTSEARVMGWPPSDTSTSPTFTLAASAALPGSTRCTRMPASEGAPKKSRSSGDMELTCVPRRGSSPPVAHSTRG